MIEAGKLVIATLQEEVRQVRQHKCDIENDMLDVCKAFVELWPVIPPRDTPKATPEVIHVWRMARDVIAKAQEYKK